MTASSPPDMIPEPIRELLDELYERYKDDAYRLACLITGSRTDGEDLAQEAFVT